MTFPDHVICNIVICADVTTLYSKFYQESDLLQQLELPAELKGYLRYKTITSQNVLSKAQIKNFFVS